MADRRVDIFDGKYSVVLLDDNKNGMDFLRHNEHWEAASRDYQHSNVIWHMANELYEARDLLVRTIKELRAIAITEVYRPAKNMHTGYTCKVCGKDWGLQEKEKHKEHCVTQTEGM